MSEFYDFVESAKSAEELPEDFWEKITDMHKSVEKQLDTTISGSQATLAEREQAIQEKEAEILKLQSMNFKLLTAQSVDNDPVPGDNEGDGPTGPQGIDSLFT